MSEPIGIIYPPPELRVRVDKTAKYVAKNGDAFEEKILHSQQGNPQFSFLLSNDPFNAYYKQKVQENRNILLGEISGESRPTNTTNGNKHSDHHQSFDNSSRISDLPQQPSSEHTDSKDHYNGGDGRDNEQEAKLQESREQGSNQEEEDDGTAAPRIRPKLDEYIQEMTIKLEEPPALNFLAGPRAALNRTDCDIIKLTALYIATYGRSFLLELVSRNQSNSQFDFLKPQHGQFAYLTNLIMQYALIRNSPLDVLDQLEKDATNQKHVLDKIKMRAEWNRMLEVEKKRKEEAEEKEKLLYSQIDWHDFVVVETIDYQPDEKGEYPPTTAEQVGTRLLIQQRNEDQVVPEEMDIDMDVESDQEEEKSNEDNFVVPEPLEPSKVIIRHDYDPRAAAKSANQPNDYFVSPITNERIPVDKIHEHVRYNLSDPKYLEKKDQMLKERMNEDAVFASGSQIQDSLKNLAERRTDIFGMNDAEAAIGQRIGEEEKEQDKEKEKLLWDGHKSSLKKKKLN